MRKKILTKGANTLFDIQKTLNKFDANNSSKIDIDEFNRLSMNIILI